MQNGIYILVKAQIQLWVYVIVIYPQKIFGIYILVKAEIQLWVYVIVIYPQKI